MEPAMKAALGFIRLENEKVDKLFRQRSRYIFDAEANIQKANEKKNEIEASASDLTEKLKAIMDQKKVKDDEMKEKGKEFEGVQQEVEDLKAAFNKLEIEDTSLREEIKVLNARRKKTKAQIEKEKETKEKLENLPEENQKKIQQVIARGGRINPVDKVQSLKSLMDKKVQALNNKNEEDTKGGSNIEDFLNDAVNVQMAELDALME